jgi:hypothetical protein
MFCLNNNEPPNSHVGALAALGAALSLVIFYRSRDDPASIGWGVRFYPR